MAAMTKPIVDPGSEAHAPELYNPAAEAPVMPLDEQLTDEHLAFYREHGYLAVESLFTPAEVDKTLATIDDLITGKDEAWHGTMYEAAVKAELDQLTPQQRRDKVR